MAPLSKICDESPPYLSTLSAYCIPLSPEKHDALREIEWSFDISSERLGVIVEQFLKEFRNGLSNNSSSAAQVLMLPTYIHDVPNGTESGIFLALDLGGTNLRVCEVTLNGDRTFSMRAQKYRVSEQLKTGSAESLFDYIAQSVDDFLAEFGTSMSPEEELHLGFTFSFPVLQTALASGTIITWTKGFKATGAVGHDVVKLLQDALDRKHIHVRCSALVNDTVGCLMAQGYQSGDALVGAIFGTGTNGAYVEKMSAIPKLQAVSGTFPKMIINTEWGAFDNERIALPVTPWDNKLDRESMNPRQQTFEKMISGMYLGELTRNVLLHLVDKLVLFHGYSSPLLNTHYGLDTAIMSKIETLTPLPGSKCTPDQVSTRIQQTKSIIVEFLQVPEKLVTDEDCVMVQRACEVVATRAARLSSTALGTVARQTGYDHKSGPMIVGVDGSVAEHYPHFESRIRAALCEVFGKELEQQVRIGLAKDGSGVGAALCALQAKKQKDALINSHTTS